MRTRWLVSCAALLLSVSACGGKSTQDRVDEYESARLSWAQTARFTAAEWIDRAVPDEFAARTLARVGDELRSEGEKLQKDSVPDDARARLLASLGAARALADSLAIAIGASDRAAAARMVAQSPRADADSLRREAGLR
jgi:hypothetical protein